jgi:hypothetical protein
VQVLHTPQKFERPPFWNGLRYGIRKYGLEVTFNGMTSLLNFIKVYQLDQKLLGGTHRQTDRQTDRQTGDLTSLTFLFEESRLKIPLNSRFERQALPHFVRSPPTYPGPDTLLWRLRTDMSRDLIQAGLASPHPSPLEGCPVVALTAVYTLYTTQHATLSAPTASSRAHTPPHDTATDCCRISTKSAGGKSYSKCVRE